jgi:hypothetical protein
LAASCIIKRGVQAEVTKNELDVLR